MRQWLALPLLASLQPPSFPEGTMAKKIVAFYFNFGTTVVRAVSDQQ
jgi:hypothetical protein